MRRYVCVFHVYVHFSANLRVRSEDLRFRTFASLDPSTAEQEFRPGARAPAGRRAGGGGKKDMFLKVVHDRAIATAYGRSRRIVVQDDWKYKTQAAVC